MINGEGSPLGAVLMGSILQNCVDGLGLNANAKLIAKTLTEQMSFEDLKSLYYLNKYNYYTDRFSKQQLEKIVSDIGDKPIAKQFYISRPSI